MRKLKLFVLIGGIAAILIAIGVITLVSYSNYQSYRSQFKSNTKNEIVLVER